MKIIKPYYEIFNPNDLANAGKAIEIAARTCYKSEDKISEYSYKTLISQLIARGHEAMLEFGPSLTVKFVCDRGVSHELVRHRLCDFAQESTRYCNYSKDKFDNQITYIIPPWIDDIREGAYSIKLGVNNRLYQETDFDLNIREDLNSNWFWALANSEIDYNKLIAGGWQPQQARAVLPNSLKTEIVMKANIREWRLIFRLRTAPVAHPQMRELMIPLLKECQSLAPELFNDIIVNE